MTLRRRLILSWVRDHTVDIISELSGAPSIGVPSSNTFAMLQMF